MTKGFKFATRLFGIALLCAMFWATSRADEWNKKTVLTFNESVEVPGAVLPANTYVFRLMDSASNRNIVQVWDKDEQHLYTTFIAVADYRLEPKGKTVIIFAERPSGQPQAIEEWFYPGDNYGWQFVYPKSQAGELAQLNKRPVPSSDVGPPVAEAAPEQTGGAVQSSEPKPSTETTQATTSSAETPSKSDELPKTGSQLALVGLIGMLSLGAAIALRLVLQRMA